MLKETIVVEGKNDAAAVRRAVEAEIIITSGFGLTRETLERIRTAQEKHGIIVLTDPDFMGEKIRNIISQRIKGVRHAYIPREEARDGNDIGVENAKPESILKALSMARCVKDEVTITFTSEDMINYGLSGSSNSTKLRDRAGSILGIGYGNSKQFLNRLNRYGITREELEAALEKAITNK
ncbi:MAG: ribonuclease M5 [Caulobacteraceae bacterium]